MAEVKSRSVASGALAIVGLLAAGIAVLWKGTAPENGAAVTDARIESPAAAPAEGEIDQSLLTPPETDLAVLERRKMAMNGSADAIQEARKEDRVGSFRTVMPPPEARASKIAPHLGENAPQELRREMVQMQKQAQASEAGPIEFIVKLNDKGLTDELRALYQKSPERASRRLKDALGDGGLIGAARLQGFTLGGEAVLRWDGPVRISEYGARQAEIQRVLSAAPGVSYAEQNYTADINSAQ